ncbi:DNA-processing protein DprA, partial [Actinoplanes sp. NPDC051633]|uniref:DNA-processing protein DprA n=1 Tax=Actinoplanes sp. NPDC051633 TaxID=3155670 RepID=UPI003443B700
MSADDERRARAILSWLTEPGNATITASITGNGATGALTALTDDILPTVVRREWRDREPQLLRRRAARAADTALAGPDRLVIPADADWPPALPADAAVGLWTRGTAPIAPSGRSAIPAGSATETVARSVAIVGARAATAYGGHVATEMATGLTDRGFAVAAISAFGVASAAIRAVLVAGGRPTVVLAGGLDRLFPAGLR